jgi:hypothetical protein
MEASAPHFSWGGRDCPHSMYCAYIYVYIYICTPTYIYIYNNNNSNNNNIYILMVRIDPHWHPMVDCWINDPIDYPMSQCIPLYMYSKYCRPTSKIPFVIHPNSLIVSTPLYTNIIKYHQISSNFMHGETPRTPTFLTRGECSLRHWQPASFPSVWFVRAGRHSSALLVVNC